MGQANTVPRRINGVEGAAGEVIISGGPGVLETWGGLPGATKEFWVPVTFTSALMQAKANYPVAGLDDLNEYALVSFFVPADFSSLTEAVFVVIPLVTDAAANWDISSGYAAHGELHNAHSENDVATTYNVTISEMEEVDISGILSALAANDYVGIRITLADGDDDFYAVGVRIKYN